ncbi:hypothetical protein F5Y01DRAFT_102391 [Xylaria sp. FL0043]|nr:hypothetical protein F5Y01DRAFT_102391 [Xylaria sp. FL0043]
MEDKQDTPTKTAETLGNAPPTTPAAHHPTTHTPAPAPAPAPAPGNATATAEGRAEIFVPPPSAADDAELTTALTRLVNKVYSEAERGIYSTDFERTSEEDIAELLRAGKVAVAYLPHLDAANTTNPKADDDPDTTTTTTTTTITTTDQNKFHQTHGSPIGCISMKQVGPSTGEFGMLAVDPTYRGAGVGRDLVSFAEAWCRGRLGLRAMRLELLAPVHFEHAGKTRLQAWYTRRLGYAFVELRDFEAAYPRLFELLSGPTEFRVFEKKFC